MLHRIPKNWLCCFYTKLAIWIVFGNTFVKWPLCTLCTQFSNIFAKWDYMLPTFYVWVILHFIPNVTLFTSGKCTKPATSMHLLSNFCWIISISMMIKYTWIVLKDRTKKSNKCIDEFRITDELSDCCRSGHHCSTETSYQVCLSGPWDGSSLNCPALSFFLSDLFLNLSLLIIFKPYDISFSYLACILLLWNIFQLILRLLSDLNQKVGV